jgi:hypothetical protein
MSAEDIAERNLTNARKLVGYAGTLPIGSNVNGTTVNLSITNQATANGEISSDVKASYSSNETNEIIEELTSKN